MSISSQQHHMQRLCVLLARDLSGLHGPRESGPNGAKDAFLHVGKTFLRALAKDLGLREVKVLSNPGGIGVSGSCTLMGMWETGGFYLCLEQSGYGRQRIALYRSIRHIRDYKGGYNQFLTLTELQKLSYPQLLERLSMLRKDGTSHGAAA